MLNKIFFISIVYFLLFALLDSNYNSSKANMTNSPASVFQRYIDNIAKGKLEEAYDMLSLEDKQVFTKDKYKMSKEYLGLGPDARKYYFNLFTITIINVDVLDNKAFVTYHKNGPHNLYMNAWEIVSKRNVDNIMQGRHVYLSTDAFLDDLNEEIIQLIKEQKYKSADLTIKQELIMENNHWKVFLDLNTKERLRYAMIKIREVDNELGISKYGKISLKEINYEDKTVKLNKMIRKYRDIINDIIDLDTDSDNNYKLKNELLETLKERIVEAENYKGAHEVHK